MPTKVPKPLGRDPREILAPGKYWLISPGARESSTWTRYAKILKSENNPGSFEITGTRENPEEDSTWIVIQVSQPIQILNSAIPKFGSYSQGDTPELLGLWDQPDPSWIHDASEAMDRLEDYGKGLSNILKPAAIALGIILGLAILSRFKK